MPSRRPGAVLLALLLLPVASAFGRHEAYHAADEDDDAALLPLRTVIDAVPTLVAEAIREGTFDGTPDRAAALAADIGIFVDEFGLAWWWPQNATSARLAPDTYSSAQALATAVRPLPGAVGTFARTHAGCRAYNNTATPGDLSVWGAGAASAATVLAASIADLDAWADTHAATTDVTTVREASRTLATWADDTRARIHACTSAVAARLAQTDPLDRYIFVGVTPNATYPSAVVSVFGGAGGVPAETVVTVRSAGLGLDRAVALSNRSSFSFTHVVPRDTTLGIHEVEVTVDARRANETVRVGRAPTRLHIEAPSTVEANQTFLFQATVLVPPSLRDEVADGLVELRGYYEADIPVTAGVASATLRTPSASGFVTLNATYRGTSILDPALANWSMQVVSPGAAIRPPPPSAPSFDLRELAVAFAMIILAVSAFFGARLLVRKLRSLRRRGLPTPRVPTAVPQVGVDPRFSPGRGVVAAFAALWTWLVGRGLLPSSTTAREAAAWLALRGVDAAGPVRAFENARYGGIRDESYAAEAVGAWSADTQRRIGEGDA